MGRHQSHQRREVPIPRFLAAELADHIHGMQPDDLLFAGIRNGRPLRVSTFRTAFSAAARTIGVPDLHPHQLRHTAASLAIASGADVKVVQQMLGHSSATMTLDTYGHLFEDRLDEVGDALDAARAAAQQRRNALRALPRVAPVLPEANSTGNAEAALPSVFAGQDPFSDWYPRPDSNRRYRLERTCAVTGKHAGQTAHERRTRLNLCTHSAQVGSALGRVSLPRMQQATTHRG